MTACKDSLNGKKAVSATLAGVLAVGMVPAAAFADAAQADTNDEQGIELLANDGSTLFAKAAVTAVDKQAGQTVDLSGKAGTTADKAIELSQKDSAAQYLVPTSITVAGEEINLDDCTVNYYEVTSVTPVDADNIKDSTKTYKMVITAGEKTGYQGQNKTVFFKLKAVKAESKITAICENGNKNDTEFVYNGSAMNMSVVYKGEVVNADDQAANTTTAQFFYKTDATGASYVSGTPTNAGTYTVKAQVSESMSVVDTKEFTVTVSPLEASADIIKIADIQKTSNDVVNALKAATTVNGAAADSSVSYTGAVDLTKTGAKTVTVNLAESKTQNGTVNVKKSSAAISFNVVDEVVDEDSFRYNGSTANSIDIDLSKGQSLDIDNFDVANNGTATDNLTFKVKKQDGTEGTLDDLKTAGTYTLTVAVDSAATDYELGGSKDFTVTVHNATVATSSVYVYQKGVVKSALTAQYNGENALDDVTVKVIANEGRKAEKELVEGTDYKVTVKNSDKEEVTEAVDAGTYTIEIEGITVDLKDNVTLTISPITITNATPTRFVTTSVKEGANDSEKFVPYTGEAIDLQLQVNIGTVDKAKWIDVPAEAYTLSTVKYYDKDKKSFVNVKEVNAKGYYQVSVKVDASHVDKNYNIQGLKAVENVYNADKDADNAADSNVWVADGTKFTDVLPSDWFYDYVNKANDNGYVKGIGGTTTFAPNASIIRGDVAVILFRMANGTGIADGTTDTDIAYNTPFSDVDGHAYYAKAIQWAAKAGIITGYGDGTFKPEQNISREEFACMLAKYAKSQGKFVASDGSDLAALPDAGSVSSWAQENVAWAVEQGLIGSAGYVAPQNAITRAEAAKMCVVYQPENSSTDFKPTK